MNPNLWNEYYLVDEHISFVSFINFFLKTTSDKKTSVKV